MPHIDRRGDLVVVQTRWSEAELIKSIPGSRWDPDDKVWTLPLTWAACVQLRGVFGADLVVGDDLAAWSQVEMAHRVAPATALRKTTTRVDGDWNALLRDFQTAGSAFLLTCGEGGLLADDLGLGKTAQVLAALDALLKLDPADALPAVVICPNGVKFDWVRQLKKWGVAGVNPHVIAGGAAQRRKLLEAARQDPRALVITNIESVRLLSRLAPYGSVKLKRCRECDRRHGLEDLSPARCEVHAKPLNGFGFRTVIVDEVHLIKDPLSKRTRACWAVAHDPSVRRRWGMTGTALANHVGDLWSVMHCLVPLEYPTKSKYVDRYALMAWNARGGLDIVGVNPEHRDEFFRILDPRFRRTPKALVRGQMPPVTRPTRWVDMNPRQRKAYEEMASGLLTVMADGEVMIAKNNLVKATRLLQLSSSYADVRWVPDPLPEDPDNERCVVTLADPSAKLDALEEDIAGLFADRRQFVVAAQSRQLIELAGRRIKKMGIPFVYITGAVPEYERDENKRKFVGGGAQAALITIDAAGTGLDGLQVADTMLVLQRSWKMIGNIQLDGRLDRMGSEAHDTVTIIDYVTRGTVEETTLYPRLTEKYERLEEINRDRERLHAEGITDSDVLFDLDRRESLVINSFLGEPGDYASEGTWDASEGEE